MAPLEKDNVQPDVSSFIDVPAINVNVLQPEPVSMFEEMKPKKNTHNK